MTSVETVGLLLNYRDATRSIGCVQSLLDEHLDRVLVWDNSGDNGYSAAIIHAAFEDQLRVSVYVSRRNVGFSAGVNSALAMIREQFPSALVLLINNDAVLLPGGVTKLVAALVANPSAVLAFPMIDHGGTVLGPVFYQRLTGRLSKYPCPGGIAYASGCCLLVAADRIGCRLFDEDFFMYGEDWELGWRLSRQLGAMAHVPEVLVRHEGSASSGLGSLFYETRMVAAHLILIRKVARNFFDAGILYALRIPMLLARATVRSLRYRSGVPWEALLRGAQVAFGSDPLHKGDAC